MRRKVHTYRDPIVQAAQVIEEKVAEAERANEEQRAEYARMAESLDRKLEERRGA